MKKTKIIEIILVVGIVIILASVGFFVIGFKEKKNDNNNLEFKPTTTRKIEFNEKEQRIVDAIYNNSEVYKYFDKKNFKSFEVLGIHGGGYYKSKPNILYVQVDYLSSCKDGTYDCDRLHALSIERIEEDGYMTFWIEIDMDTYTILDVMTGISVSINSDWTQVVGKIE